MICYITYYYAKWNHFELAFSVYSRRNLFFITQDLSFVIRQSFVIINLEPCNMHVLST